MGNRAMSDIVYGFPVSEWDERQSRLVSSFFLGVI